MSIKTICVKKCGHSVRYLHSIQYPAHTHSHTVANPDSISENRPCCIVRLNAAYYHINTTLAAVQPSDMDGASLQQLCDSSPSQLFISLIDWLARPPAVLSNRGRPSSISN